MPVNTDADGRPEVWGDKINGKDIPDPPEPAQDYRWNGDEWVHDPVATTTDDELKQQLRDARAAGDMQGQIDAIFTLVTGEQP